MKQLQKHILCVLLFIFSAAVFSQKPAKLIKRQQKDFTIFKTTLFEVEAKPFRHIAEDSLNYFLTNLETKLGSEVISTKEQFLNYSQIIQKIQSGHTSVQPNKKTFGQWIRERNSLPVDVKLVGKKLYTLNDYDLYPPEQMKKLSGKDKKKNHVVKYTEIVRIDGVSIEQWMDRIGKYVSADEDFIDFKYFAIKDLFEFYRSFAVTEKKDSVKIDIIKRRDTSSLILKLNYPPLEDINKRFKEDKKKEKERKKDRGEFKMLTSKIACFKFNTFAESEGKKYTKFLNESFKKINDKEIEKLVIDLRGNLGGVIQLELLRHFQFKNDKDIVGSYTVLNRNKPTYMKHIKRDENYRKNKKAIRKFKKMEKRGFNGTITEEHLTQTGTLYNGKIVVLTDGGSFSAASLLASQLKDLCDAKIVGTCSGGSFHEGVSGTYKLKLPNSKILIYFNPNYYTSSLNVDSINHDVKKPDIELIELFGNPQKTKNKNKKNLKKSLKLAFKK